MTLLKLIAAASCIVGLSHAAIAQDSMEDFDDDDLEECQLRLDVSQSTVEWDGAFGKGYDVFDSVRSYEPLQLTIGHRGEECRYFVTATPLSPGAANTLTNGSDTLYFDLRRDTNGPSILSTTIEGSPSTRIEGAFSEGQAQLPVTLSLAIPPSQFAESGLYRGQVIVRLFKEENESVGFSLVDELPVEIVAPVAARLRIRSEEFAEGAQQTSIDLGELSSGVRRELAFEVRSNSPVEVKLESSNRGELAHNVGDFGIPYQILANGRIADLSVSSAEFRIDASEAGREFPFEIEVPADNYPAGQYSDTLLVTFTAG